MLTEHGYKIKPTELNYYIAKFVGMNNESIKCDLCSNDHALRIVLEDNGEDSLVKSLCIGCLNMLNDAKKEFIESTTKSLKERNIEIGE